MGPDEPAVRPRLNCPLEGLISDICRQSRMSPKAVIGASHELDIALAIFTWDHMPIIHLGFANS